MVSGMAPRRRGPSVGRVHAFLLSYGLRDATPAEHAELCEQLAPAVAAVPGLVSATWLANPATGRFGGFYVFASRGDFDRFVASELFEALRAHHSVRDVSTSDYAVSARPTAVTGGPPRVA